MSEIGYAQAGANQSVSHIGERPREAATVSLIFKRFAEVSESIGSRQEHAFILADRAEALANRLAGSEPPSEVGTASRAVTGRDQPEPSALIELLFVAVDRLDPQVNALRSPLARIAYALDRLERTLG